MTLTSITIVAGVRVPLNIICAYLLKHNPAAFSKSYELDNELKFEDVVVDGANWNDLLSCCFPESFDHVLFDSTNEDGLRMFQQTHDQTSDESVILGLEVGVISLKSEEEHTLNKVPIDRLLQVFSKVKELFEAEGFGKGLLDQYVSSSKICLWDSQNDCMCCS